MSRFAESVELPIRCLRFIRRIFASILLVAIVLGCGGHGSGTGLGSAGRGSLSVTIHWPAGSRVIPEATNSLRFKVTVLMPIGGPEVANVVAPRPASATSTVQIPDLPSVKVAISVSAHASTDGTGAVLAIGFGEVDLIANANTPAQIELQSAIVRLDIEPDSANLSINLSMGLTVRAFDANDFPVVVDPSAWEWSIVPGNVASLSPSGASATVTGVAIGSAVASVTLLEAGLSASVNVIVSEEPCENINATYGGDIFDVTNGLDLGVAVAVVSTVDCQTTITILDQFFNPTGIRFIGTIVIGGGFIGSSPDVEGDEVGGTITYDPEFPFGSLDLHWFRIDSEPTLRFFMERILDPP